LQTRVSSIQKQSPEVRKPTAFAKDLTELSKMNFYLSNSEAKCIIPGRNFSKIGKKLLY